MTRILARFAAVVATLSPLVHAGIKFTAPAAGSALVAGSAITVQWSETDAGPKLADLKGYQLQLVVGGDKGEEQMIVATITPSGLFSAGNTASGRVEASVSEDLKDANAYFIKMIATGKAGDGQYVVYSDRFSFSGMTGKNILNPTVEKAATSVTGTAGPASEDTLTEKDPAAGGDLYTVEYTMQTDITRYAPMQPVPGTKITATNTKPLYPTSSVRIAKTKLPTPSQVVTLTATQTFSTESRANTVAPAPHATDDMAKFLRRWQD